MKNYLLLLFVLSGLTIFAQEEGFDVTDSGYGWFLIFWGPIFGGLVEKSLKWQLTVLVFKNPSANPAHQSVDE